MKDALSHELPQARVNITLDLETHGAQEKTELPLRILVLNDFASKQKQLALEDRCPVSCNTHNLSDVMQKERPRCRMDIKNHLQPNMENPPSIHIDMIFSCLNDFSPDAILQKVPQLKKLMGMRALLADLQSRMINNPRLKVQVENLIRAYHTNKKRLSVAKL